MSNIHIMVGVPASGKTTYIKNCMQNTVGSSCIHISRDAIRFSMLKDDDEYFKYETEVFDTFVDSINEAITKDIDYIFVDQTSLSPGSRRKLLRGLKISEKDCLVFDVFRCKLETVMERNNKREGVERVPEKEMTSMFKSFVSPNIEREGLTKYGTDKVYVHAVVREY